MHDSGLKSIFRNVRLVVILMAAILGSDAIQGPARAQQRVIVTSDGKEITVDNLKIDDVRLVYQSDGQPLEIPTEHVAAIRSATPLDNSGTRLPFLTGLNDGSKLLTDKILFDGEFLTIKESGGNDWRLARRDLAWVRLDNNEAESIDRMWQDLLGREDRSGDWLVFNRNDQLDFLEGLVGKITESAIEFTASGQTNQAPRNRIFGVVFFQGVKKAFAPAVGKLRTIDGDEFPASKIRFNTGSISLTTIGGIEVEIPSRRFLEFEASKQKFVIVSKLRPTTVEWKPLVANSSIGELQQQWNRPRFDTTFKDELLSLHFPSGKSSWSSHQLVEYTHGIAARTGTRLVYEIDGEFSRLSGIAGFAPDLQATGSADLVVNGDGKELFRKTMNEQVNEPVSLDVEVTGIQRLTIQLEYGDGAGFGGVFHLCDLKLER